MKERPILFSGPMVRAILEGRKTQTRRIFRPENMVVKWIDRSNVQWLDGEAPVPSGWYYYTSRKRRDGSLEPTGQGPFDPNDWLHYCPYGQPGDRLWVRETWGWSVRVSTDGNDRRMREHDKSHLLYRATADHESDRWRPSIHMPRWASRITLEVVGARVERLRDISEGDSREEGVTLDFAHGIGCTCGEYRCRYGNLWESINGPGSWDANPWVWVVEFKRIQP